MRPPLIRLRTGATPRSSASSSRPEQTPTSRTKRGPRRCSWRRYTDTRRCNSNKFIGITLRHVLLLVFFFQIVKLLVEDGGARVNERNGLPEWTALQVGTAVLELQGLLLVLFCFFCRKIFLITMLIILMENIGKNGNFVPLTTDQNNLFLIKSFQGACGETKT